MNGPVLCCWTTSQDTTHMDLSRLLFVMFVMFVEADGIGGVTHEWLAPKIREITNRILLILKALLECRPVATS